MIFATYKSIRSPQHQPGWLTCATFCKLMPAAAVVTLQIAHEKWPAAAIELRLDDVPRSNLLHVLLSYPPNLNTLMVVSLRPNL